MPRRRRRRARVLALHGAQAVSRFDADVKTSRAWLVDIGVEVLQRADRHSNHVTYLLDRVRLVTALVSLPDEQVLRLRCLPGIFTYQA